MGEQQWESEISNKKKINLVVAIQWKLHLFHLKPFFSTQCWILISIHIFFPSIVYSSSCFIKLVLSCSCFRTQMNVLNAISWHNTRSLKTVDWYFFIAHLIASVESRESDRGDSCGAHNILKSINILKVLLIKKVIPSAGRISWEDRRSIFNSKRIDFNRFDIRFVNGQQRKKLCKKGMFHRFRYYFFLSSEKKKMLNELNIWTQTGNDLGSLRSLFHSLHQSITIYFPVPVEKNEWHFPKTKMKNDEIHIKIKWNDKIEIEIRNAVWPVLLCVCVRHLRLLLPVRRTFRSCRLSIVHVHAERSKKWIFPFSILHCVEQFLWTVENVSQN